MARLSDNRVQLHGVCALMQVCILSMYCILCGETTFKMFKGRRDSTNMHLVTVKDPGMLGMVFIFSNTFNIRRSGQYYSHRLVVAVT